MSVETICANGSAVVDSKGVKTMESVTNTLEMVFSAGKSTFTVSIPNPKVGLTLDEVKEKAPDIANVMMTRSGVRLGDFIKADITQNTRTPLT